MIHHGPWSRESTAPEIARRPRELSDRELVLAYLVHDDQRAYRTLYERLLPYLTAVARRRVGEERASDLVQQALLNAHAARDTFDLDCTFRPWVTRILVNLCVDDCRTRQRWQASELDPAELEAPLVDDQPDRDRRAALARRALSRLAPRKRRVIEMHFLEERPFPEVAEELDERLSTVKVRAHRAYKELRRALDAEA